MSIQSITSYIKNAEAKGEDISPLKHIMMNIIKKNLIELDKSIKEFIIYSKKLINTVKLYGYEEKEIYYLEDTKYKPYIKNSVEVF
jgi:hypothetical protein